MLTEIGKISDNSVSIKKVNGGRRPGAGRKKKSATRVKEWLIENEILDAKDAYLFLAATMRDKREGKAIRIDCAKEVLNRVLGKSTTRIESPVVDSFLRTFLVRSGGGEDDKKCQ